MAKSIVNNNTVSELLSSDKKGDLRKGVKLAVNNVLYDFADDLYNILNNHISDGKMWEMNYDIIRLLGKAKYNKVTPILEDICNKNEDHDMVTSAASTALSRIKRTNINDVDEVKRLLTFGNFAVVDGALRSMGIDRVMPKEEEVNEIIHAIKAFEPKIETGYADIREGLAVACAGWIKNQETKSFLDDCIQSGDSALAKLATSAQKGKYADIDY